MISQITNLEPAGSFPKRDGTGLMYKYFVTFATGVRGEANTKTPQPPYRIGDTMNYEITGNFQGIPKLKISKPQQAGAPAQAVGYQQPPAQQYQQPPAAQQYQAPVGYAPPPAQNYQQPPQGAPATPPWRPEPQAVGMCLKAAIELALFDKVPPSGPDFLTIVHGYASDLLRIGYHLGNGTLAPKRAERGLSAPVQEQAPPPPPAKPLPGPEGSAFPPSNVLDEDVPF